MTTRNPEISVQIRLRDSLSKALRATNREVKNFRSSMVRASQANITSAKSLETFEKSKKRVEKNLVEASKKVKTFTGRLDSLSDGSSRLGRRLTESITLPLGAVILMVGKLNDQASRLQIAPAFERAATAADLSSKELLAAMSEAAEGTVSQADLMRSATRVLESGMTKDFGEIVNLTRVARDSSIRFSEDTTESFDKLVRAIVTGEADLADQIGIYLQASQVANSLGVSVGQVTGEMNAQKKMSMLLQSTLKQGNERIAKGAAVSSDAARSWAEMTAAVRDSADQLLKVAIPALNLLLGIFTKLPGPVQASLLAFFFLGLVLGPLLQAFSVLIGLVKAVTLAIQFLTVVEKRAILVKKLHVAWNFALAAAQLVAAGAAFVLALALTPIGILVIALAAAAVLLFIAWKKGWIDMGAIVDAVVGAFQAAFSKFKGFLNGIKTKFVETIAFLKEMWNRFKEWLVLAIPIVGPLLFGIRRLQGKPLSGVPTMDTGGVVKGPGLFRVGAGVQEIVNPARGGGMGGSMINFNVPEGSMVFLNDELALDNLASLLEAKISGVGRGVTRFA